MRIVHILAGLGPLSGVANMARRFARMQRERGDEVVMLAPAWKWNPIYFSPLFAYRAWREVQRADEVWVHCSWTFPVWFGAWLAKKYGRKLIVVPSGSFDPKRLHNESAWKKRLVASHDRKVLRAADEVYALCPDEVEWIKSFEPSANAKRVKVPMFGREGISKKEEGISSEKKGARSKEKGVSAELKVLFLGRAEDPLKGVRFLAKAIEELNHRSSTSTLDFDYLLRLVRNHTGEELDRDWEWCDVLCLPSLSENFGLVVAEAIERGKKVITTDGASAWADYEGEGFIYLKGFRDGTDEQRVELLKDALLKMVGHQEVAK